MITDKIWLLVSAISFGTGMAMLGYGIGYKKGDKDGLHNGVEVNGCHMLAVFEHLCGKVLTFDDFDKALDSE